MDLPPAEREYRRLGAERADDVAGAASPARATLLAVHAERAKVGAPVGDDEPFEVIGRLTGDPRMVVLAGEAKIGLDVDTIGVMVGDLLFVDATRVVDDESPFAGEETLVEIPRVAPPERDDPRATLAAWISAAKCNDEEAWSALVAAWELESHQSGVLLFFPWARDKPTRFAAGWQLWRTWLLERTFGVVPARVPEPRLIDPVLATGLVWRAEWSA